MASELLDCVREFGPEVLGKITQSFTLTIARSFREDMSRQTINESRRRFGILEREFRELRSLSWGVDKILDVLPTVLRCRLDGIPWSADDQRTLWVPPQRLSH